MITEYAMATCEYCGKQEQARPEYNQTGRWMLPLGWLYVGIAYAGKGIQREMTTIVTWSLCSTKCERAKLHQYAEAFVSS